MRRVEERIEEVSNYISHYLSHYDHLIMIITITIIIIFVQVAALCVQLQRQQSVFEGRVEAARKESKQVRHCHHDVDDGHGHDDGHYN